MFRVRVNLTKLAAHLGREQGTYFTDGAAAFWLCASGGTVPVFRRVPGEIDLFTCLEPPSDFLRPGEICDCEEIPDPPEPRQKKIQNRREKDRRVRADLERCLKP